MKKLLQILNVLFFIGTLYVNYASSAGLINNTSQSTMSAKYQTLFTPAAYAFSIWGIIYLLLLGFILYQSRSLFIKTANDSFIEKTGIWFIASCMANSLWCYLFVSDYIIASTFVIFFILFCLLQIKKNNTIKLGKASIATYLFLWLPFIMYSGWITVACIANVTVYLIKIQWNGWEIAPELWTLFMIGIATAVNLLVTWRRNIPEFALVGVWALVAIGVANAGSYESIKTAAYIAAGILTLSSGLQIIKSKKHNPNTNERGIF